MTKCAESQGTDLALDARGPTCGKGSIPYFETSAKEDFNVEAGLVLSSRCPPSIVIHPPLPAASAVVLHVKPLDSSQLNTLELYPN